MRYVLRKTVPSIREVLFVESGPREVAERFVPVLRKVCGDDVVFDLFTCQPEPSGTLEASARNVFRSRDWASRGKRGQLLKLLKARGYSAIVLLCADSPLLFRSKWWLALRLPVKVLVANENADCYWLDSGHWRNAKGMVAARYDLRGTGSLKAVVEIALFPFVLAWLLAYAAVVHARRGMRLLFRRHRMV